MININFDNDILNEDIEIQGDPQLESTTQPEPSDIRHLQEFSLKTFLKDIDDGNEGLGKELKNANDRLKNAHSELNTYGNIAGKVNDAISSNTIDGRSIVARARNSVCQFPVYIVQTVRANEGQIIAGLFERVYASFIQSVIAANPIMSEAEANNFVFLQKFHTNIKENTDLILNPFYEPIDELDAMMCESLFHKQQLTENCSVEFRVVPTTDEALIHENARLLNEPLQGFSYIREAYVNSDHRYKIDDTILKEDDLRNAIFDYGRNFEKSTDPKEKDRYFSDDVIKLSRKYSANCTPEELQKKDEIEQRIQNAIDAFKQDIRDDKKLKDQNASKYERRKKGMLSDTHYIDGSGRIHHLRQGEQYFTKTSDSRLPMIKAPEILKDTDIKKINKMLPYQLICTFRLKCENGDLKDVSYVIGVKTVLHPIRAQDLADELRDLVMGNERTLQKVRYKTGEISFMDYMLNLKGLKSDAAKHTNYNKRWINTLKRLADFNKTNGSLLKNPVKFITNGNVPIPNGTLVLTQLDVTMLTNQTGIDLSDVKNAKKLAKSLFLIAIAIIDSSAGTIRVLFPDMDNDWDVQSLAAIDAEVSKTDNSQLMKELNRMVNR